LHGGPGSPAGRRGADSADLRPARAVRSGPPGARERPFPARCLCSGAYVMAGGAEVYIASRPPTTAAPRPKGSRTRRQGAAQAELELSEQAEALATRSRSRGLNRAEKPKA